MAEPFDNHRDAALTLLCSSAKFSPKEGRFLGQIAVNPSQLSVKQADWLRHLLRRAGMPLLGGERS